MEHTVHSKIKTHLHQTLDKHTYAHTPANLLAGLRYTAVLAGSALAAPPTTAARTVCTHAHPERARVCVEGQGHRRRGGQREASKTKTWLMIYSVVT